MCNSYLNYFTKKYLEEFLVLVMDDKEQIVDGSCHSNSSGVTKVTAVLTPFYYLLLVVPVRYCIKFHGNNCDKLLSYDIHAGIYTEHFIGITIKEFV